MPATLTDRIPEIVADAEVRAAEVVAAVCMKIKAGAQRNLVANGSVVSGNLLGSIEEDASGLYGEVSTGVEYARYVEYGTGQRGEESEFEGKPDDITYSEGWTGMSARPYLTPAAEEQRLPFLVGIQGIYG